MVPPVSFPDDDDDGALDWATMLRPRLSKLLRAAGLDVVFHRGAGDHLFTIDLAGPAETAVLDLAGGFGTTLLGHNHPTLVAALHGALAQGRPFSAQMSVRAPAGAAARALSTMIERETRQAARVFFLSTGAEAVEAALAFCALDVARKEGDAGAVAFLVVEGSYHGRTTGASALSARGRTIDGSPLLAARGLNARIVSLPRNDVAAIGAALAELSAAGVVVAGAFAEPVQGEGGGHVLADDFLAALRRAADDHDFPLVFDEIQCGLGRTGRLLAGSHAGVVPDAVLLGKALGGSLVKAAALVVLGKRASSRGPDLELEATSTFADDDLSAVVIAATLGLIEREDVSRRCAEQGAVLSAGLAALLQQHPKSVAAVRGRGLLQGVALATDRIASQTTSPLLRLLVRERLLSGVVAGHLLHVHHVRVAPCLSARSTLRLEPSAFITSDDLTHAMSALHATLQLLDDDDPAALLGFLGGVPRPRRSSALSATSSTAASSTSSVTPTTTQTARVGFLACFGEASDLGRFDPRLASLDADAQSALLERALPALPPFVFGTATVDSLVAEVEVTAIGVPFLASSAMAALRAGDSAALDVIRAALDGAVALAQSDGCVVLGLGGHTSILAAALGINIALPTPTNGSALTAAAALAASFATAAARGLHTADLVVGIVGAAGSIGAALADVVARRGIRRLVLVGRPGNERRLAAVAAQHAGVVDVAVSTDLFDLRGCHVVFAASNAARPIVFADHLAKDAIVCDIAVPGDVDALPGRDDVVVLAGGQVVLPGGQSLSLPALDLGKGHIYGCLGEALLMGLAGVTEPGVGTPSPARIVALMALLQTHGFAVGAALRSTSTSKEQT